MAVQILKRAGEHDVKVAQVEIEIAWTCIASLMTLGPNFVRPHLPQLLVLWRNALPKPTTKDGAANRSVAEWAFLLHVRESTVGAIHCFLKHNSPTLVSADVTRRISSLLSNGLAFANTFLTSRAALNQEELAADNKGLGIDGREALLRSRVFQCFSLLGFGGVTESVQSSLLQSVISLFASLDGYTGSSVQAAIASSAGTFTNIWQSVDGYAYGLTSLQVDESPKDWMNRDGIETAFDEMVSLMPVLRVPLLMVSIDSETHHHWAGARRTLSMSSPCRGYQSSGSRTTSGCYGGGGCRDSPVCSATSSPGHHADDSCRYAAIGISGFCEAR